MASSIKARIEKKSQAANTKQKQKKSQYAAINGWFGGRGERRRFSQRYYICFYETKLMKSTR